MIKCVRNYFHIFTYLHSRVVLLEDAKGESHLRNLNVLPVYSEQEAMRLLFLGDTNRFALRTTFFHVNILHRLRFRIISETPLNDCSSRSHCIFTIHITMKLTTSGRIRKSKLHLVDLAGLYEETSRSSTFLTLLLFSSERIYKSNITGLTLNEAKQINLSLHYLEQVILALSQSKRFHIPYRNSMLTYMLRDSLSGNCLTVMLATVALNVHNINVPIPLALIAKFINTQGIIVVGNDINVQIRSKSGFNEYRSNNQRRN